MLIALDTNILLYAEGVNDAERQRQARDVVGKLGEDRILVPAQVLGELFHALTRKLRLSPASAKTICEEWQATTRFHVPSEECWNTAFELASDTGLQVWDALILAAAAEAGCRMLLSEDMQHGFVFGGVTLVNPFAEPMHPLLADALRQPR